MQVLIGARYRNSLAPFHLRRKVWLDKQTETSTGERSGNRNARYTDAIIRGASGVSPKGYMFLLIWFTIRSI